PRRRPPPPPPLFPYTTLFRSPATRGRSRAIGDLEHLAEPAAGHHGIGGAAQPNRHGVYEVGQVCAAACTGRQVIADGRPGGPGRDRKSTRLNSSHRTISYAVF